jgi:hypothetical protein
MIVTAMPCKRKDRNLYKVLVEKPEKDSSEELGILVDERQTFLRSYWLLKGSAPWGE